MSLRIASSTVGETSDGYDQLESVMSSRIESNKDQLFTTDADPELLWAAYLDNIPAERRQHYNCNCCKNFIQNFAGLVRIDQVGLVHPLLADTEGVPVFFVPSFAALRKIVLSTKVNGVFVSSESVFGRPRTGEWTHLSGRNSKPYQSPVKSSFQRMAELKEDHGILSRSLADYPLAVVREAVRVLTLGDLYRSEKAEAIGNWFLALQERLGQADRMARHNLVWLATATAPVGFCGVRSTVISTLLDDIKAGLPFEGISRRWAEKLHPLQYQRPQAALAAGTIRQAEELVERLGLARSFLRRYAKIEEVQATLWRPRPEPSQTQSGGGIFDHLKKTAPPVKSVTLPTVTMTWEKFAKTILPGATEMEVETPSGRGSFFGLVTAVDPDAPPILQWDGLDGCPRNPVNWYFYHGGSTASQWNLPAASWVKVTAIFKPPHQWQVEGRFTNHGQKIMFALEGCQDVNNSGAGLALFPEVLRSELHGVRSVIEAHSKHMSIQGATEGTANGIAIGGGNVLLRVRTNTGLATYEIDRLD